MLHEIPYNRNQAVSYARAWALGRNPRYLDFENLGGDCTSYASQCLFAGCGVMNYTPTFGWYYNSAGDRTPSWSGVEYLYNFLTGNQKTGPYAREISASELQPGDLVQLGDASGRFYHTPIVTELVPGDVLVCAHSFDALDRPLSSYLYADIRFLHIEGARRW